MEITVKEYMKQQPGFPEVSDTDKYYYVIAVHLARAWDKCNILTNIDEKTRIRVVLALIGYYQDIVADAGLWRTFTSLHNAHYGTPLPHFECNDDYIDYELNLDDIRYLIWYTLDNSAELEQKPSPQSDEILQLAQQFYYVLDYDYEKAPVPVELKMLTGVDIDDEADMQTTYDLAHWFYWRSYMMQVSAMEATASVMDEAQALITQHGADGAVPYLHDLNDFVMASRPARIGPISLPLSEWLIHITK